MERPGRQGSVTLERFELLVGLMWALRGVGRGSVLVLDAEAEPVLSVPVPSRRRSVAVLGVQECDGGWAFLWDGVCKAPAGSTLMAARQIAEVER
ncbi:hypothetical protein [Actinomadura chokoriensis]|uniref:hypothetical protein n=1 Tax=Actinomadura chokoriensis TaxID=454156 RepID=UPI0031FA02A7